VSKFASFCQKLTWFSWDANQRKLWQPNFLVITITIPPYNIHKAQKFGAFWKSAALVRDALAKRQCLDVRHGRNIKLLRLQTFRWKGQQLATSR
jgi:hypothetical protein